MKGLRRTLRALLWGGATGLAALALDQLLARVTLGFHIRLDLIQVVAYAAAGAAVAGLLEAAGLLFRRPHGSAFGIVASTSAILYAASTFERLEQALPRRSELLVAAAAAVLALLGWALWILVLRTIVAKGRRSSARDATSYALVLASSSAALGLAVNRNLVTRPLEPAALAADAAVLVVGLLLACGIRFAGPLRTSVAAAVLLSGAVFATAFAPGLSSRPSSSDAPPHPHLVLLVVDTLRQDVFEAVIEETAEGRAFREALGGAGWFDRAVATSPWTAPSVASIMTGLYPPEHGLRAAATGAMNRPLTRLSDSVTTLAERLRAEGYRTAAIVTNPMLHPVSGISRGFQHFEVLAGATAKMPLLTVLTAAGLLPRDRYQDASVARGRLAVRLADVAGDRPLFLWLHLMDPHQPLRRHRGLSADPKGRELEDDERLYRDETRFALRETTGMIELLRSAGLWSNAVFVLVSDHGEMFASDDHAHLPPDRPRGDGHGHALYDELMRVPLVIRPPGGLAGDRRIGVLASQVDLCATLRDLLGLDDPRFAAGGVSLAPWLGSHPVADAPRKRLYSLIGSVRVGTPQRGVVTESHKLIRYDDDDMTAELFDLASDPGERHNLAELDAAALSELDELLARTWSELRQAPDVSEPVEIDDETRRRLEALGYR